MTTTNGQQFEITHGPARAVVNEIGGGLRVCEFGGVPLVESYAADEAPPMGAGSILLPWPNRVGSGRWEWDGQAQKLPLTEPERDNAIHGLVRELAWSVVSHEPGSVTLETDVEVQDGWPVPLHTTVRYEVGDEGLQATHTVANVGDAAVPFGLGVHPYVRAGHAAVDACLLRLAATTVQPVDAERQLPDGPPQPVEGTDLDFRTGRPLAGLQLDLPFGGCEPSALPGDGDGDGGGPLRVRHTLTGPGGGVEVWADPAFGWVQVFTSSDYPGRERVVAVEPATCPPNALQSGTDLVTLDPGETWSASWGLRPLT
jgi:aldose 1-epimerase